MQHTWLLHPVILATLKEGVKQVGQVGDDALALGLAQQHVVPLPQPVTPGRLLTMRMTVQDVVISLHISEQQCERKSAHIAIWVATHVTACLQCTPI